MKLAFATTFDSRDIGNWSGTPFHMANALEKQGIHLERIGNLSRRLPILFKPNQFLKKMIGQRESPRHNIVAAKHYSAQVAKKLATLPVDAVVSPLINPIAYLDGKQSNILWTDGLYASLIGFYPGFSSHSASSIEQGNLITRECLKRCKLAIFSSDWAARTALEIYGASKEKVKVVPFGANMECHHTMDDIRTMVKKRSRDKSNYFF